MTGDEKAFTATIVTEVEVEERTSAYAGLVA